MNRKKPKTEEKPIFLGQSKLKISAQATEHGNKRCKFGVIDQSIIHLNASGKENGANENDHKHTLEDSNTISIARSTTTICQNAIHPNMYITKLKYDCNEMTMFMTTYVS